jgi:hypothetical protein
MLVRLAVGVIAFACALLCALAASFLVFKMVSEVNKRLPREQQFSPLGRWSKYQRLNAEYKRLYPDGNLWRRYRILMALMFASGLVSAWVFGIFGR